MSLHLKTVYVLNLMALIISNVLILSQFATSHEGLCTTVDSQTFQILFTEDNPNTRLTGITVGKPF